MKKENNKTVITLIATAQHVEMIGQAMKTIEEKYGKIIDLHSYFYNHIEYTDRFRDAFRQSLRCSDIILLDVRSLGETTRILHEELAGSNQAVISLVPANRELMAFTVLGSFKAGMIPAKEFAFDQAFSEMGKVWKMQAITKKIGTFLPIGMFRHMRNWIYATEYWNHFGIENIVNLLLMMTKYYGKKTHCRIRYAKPKLKKPTAIVRAHTQEEWDDLDTYLAVHPLDPKLPTLGVLLYQGMHYYETLPVLEALTRKLAGRANVIAVYAWVTVIHAAIQKYFMPTGQPIIDALFNLQIFNLNNGPFGGPTDKSIELLQKLNVPYFLPPKMYYRTIQRWQDDKIGLAPMDTLLGVVLPELDGALLPLPCGGPYDAGVDEHTGNSLVKNQAIDERLDRITNIILGWIKLRQLSNEQKKVAFIIYNFPPGEDNLGNDAYLDVFQSLRAILKSMKAEGYAVDIPEKPIQELFIEKGLVNSAQWLAFKGILADSGEYEKFFRTLSPGNQELVTRAWGPAPGGHMVKDGQFMIPGMIFGNVFIGVQPSRGIHENSEKALHDKNIPPHHQYIGFYHWLREIFQADICVHVGTHGLLEFTYGKEVGLSGDCFPDIMLRDIPHGYIYWVVNASEATIAKRRSMAGIVNHRSPVYTTSGLYGELAEIEDLLQEHQEALVQDSGRCEIIREQLQTVADKMGLVFESLEDLHSQVSYMKRSIIPHGLHVLGQPVSNESLSEYLTFVLRYDREGKALHRILCEMQGYDYTELLEIENGTKKPAGAGQATAVLEEVNRQAGDLVKKIVAQESITVAKNHQQDMNQVVVYAQQLIRNIKKSAEMENLLRLLNGEYIPARVGGDEIRTPEVYPTGSNTYQFDGRMIPSMSAYERGKIVAKKTLQAYKDKHGTYPQSVSLVLWGFETVKTRGETIGQIYHYLGLRPHRKDGPTNPGFEVIPLPELGRPRIDVVIEICGIFRDTLPNLMILLDRAVKLAAAQDEPAELNYVRQHTQAIANALDASWLPKERERLSQFRIFGPSANEYASALRSRIETSNWTKEEELAETFINSMHYAYGEGTGAVEQDEVFRSLLKTVDLVSQIRDTHDYEVTDLDHYYEYSGGLTKSVEQVKGKAPETFITDTTKELIRTEELEESIARGLRTRLLNPKWIKAMLEHDYLGAEKIHERVENTLAFAATTHKVGNWAWEKIADTLIFDKDMRRRLEQNNRFAAARIVDRMLEAQGRGYWQANEEKVHQLRESQSELEGWLEEEAAGRGLL